VSLALGSGDAVRAQRMAAVGVGLALPLVAALAGGVALFARDLAKVFSGDSEVADLYHGCRFPLAAVVGLMSLSVVLERVPLAMGRSDVVLGVGLVGSWGCQVPAVVASTTLWRNDLFGLFAGVAAGYGCLVLALAGVVLTTDWSRFAAEASGKMARLAAERDTRGFVASASGRGGGPGGEPGGGGGGGGDTSALVARFTQSRAGQQQGSPESEGGVGAYGGGDDEYDDGDYNECDDGEGDEDALFPKSDVFAAAAVDFRSSGQAKSALGKVAEDDGSDGRVPFGQQEDLAMSF